MAAQEGLVSDDLASESHEHRAAAEPAPQQAGNRGQQGNKNAAAAAAANRAAARQDSGRKHVQLSSEFPCSLIQEDVVVLWDGMQLA